MILCVPLSLIFVLSVEPELKAGQDIALAVILAAIASFLIAMIAAPRESREEYSETSHTDEAERALEELERELLSIYTSLSQQYEKISDFLYLYPEYAARLKNTERYKDWRERLLFWADENIERLKEFYFDDGEVCYINKGLKLVNLYENQTMEPNPGAIVVCEVSLTKNRVPEDYFEHAFSVWEDEDIDDSAGSRRSDYTDASTTGIVLGIGLDTDLSLSGHDSYHNGHCCDGGDCGGQ